MTFSDKSIDRSSAPGSQLPRLPARRVREVVLPEYSMLGYVHIYIYIYT